ncbi:MAG: alanine--tRNA ligase-related protein, partial [Gaiellales bacterium]
VIRRAVLHGRRIGLDRPFLVRLQDRVIELLGDVYPELRSQRDPVARLLEGEEERFSRTLETGGRLLDEVLERSEGVVSAEDAFKLHDTYGFPFELTAEIAAEHGKAVDEAGFAVLMEQQRERARASTVPVGFETLGLEADFTTEFVGYETLDVRTQIGACSPAGDGTLALKLRESPFYAAGGGQVSDTGYIESDVARAAVERVIRRNGDQELVVRPERGTLTAGERVRAHVAAELRRPTMANHTATHLLHASLRHVLGEHVAQAGSYVGPDKLRFDFRHPSPMTPEELAEVERLVNETILENRPVHTFVTSLDHARELGATMLFGEKYGEHVRVVEVPEFSRELCGGTHVRSTAEIGAFVLQRESSSSQGVRRIEAITSAAAVEYLRDQARRAEELERELAKRDALIRKLQKRGGGDASGNGVDAGLIEGAAEEAGVHIVAAVVEETDGDVLLAISDRLKRKLAPAAVVLGSTAGGKVHLIANFDQPVVERGVSAVDVIREVAPLIGGGGGGRPTMARAGGRDPERLEAAVTAAGTAIRERLRRSG